MTNEKSRAQLTALGFNLTDFGYYGIYRHEVFENADLEFILAMDKCYYESFLYLRAPVKTGGAFAGIARMAIGNEGQIPHELMDERQQPNLQPDKCVEILTDHYDRIISYLQQQRVPE